MEECLWASPLHEVLLLNCQQHNIWLWLLLWPTREVPQSHSYCQLMTARMVDTSNNIGVSKAQLVLTHDDCTIKNSWTLKSFITFSFPRMSLESFTVKNFIISRTSLQFLKDHLVMLPASVIHQRINPEGLSKVHQHYVFPKQRQLCRPEPKNFFWPV